MKSIEDNTILFIKNKYLRFVALRPTSLDTFITRIETYTIRAIFKAYALVWLRCVLMCFAFRGIFIDISILGYVFKPIMFCMFSCFLFFSFIRKEKENALYKWRMTKKNKKKSSIMTRTIGESKFC